VQSVTTSQIGDRVRMVVNPAACGIHSAYQSDNQFVLEVRAQKADPNKLVQGSGYAGEKLSLNFQNIEVRALLQVIADFTNFNVVTSDTVTGSVTLRLKDVPWDQALDIILQAKNLGLRKSGNVILIAPKDELNAKEKIELESKLQISALEPVRSQSFQLNYAKADDVAKGISGQGASGGAGGSATATRILSSRGSVISEPRTNQLFINDIPSKLEEIQNLIAKIDIPVRQVLIESRIVIADDSFGRSLGVRLGVNDCAAVRSGCSRRCGGSWVHAVAVGLTGSSQTLATGCSPTPLRQPPARRQNGFNPASFALSLFGATRTASSNLEISRLEADGKARCFEPAGRHG
jgi:type IV pilus assembly protein PilQ